MDVNLGWRGICIDAVLRRDKFASRSCRLVEAVIHNESGKTMSFQRFPGHHESAYGGLQSETAVAGVSGDAVLGKWESVPVVTVTIADVLKGLAEDGFTVPSIIDYVSVDVEGA